MIDLQRLKAVWYTPKPRKKGKIYYSASQFKTFNDCEMQWGYDKLDRLPRVESIYTEFGTSGHKLAEAHLKDDDLPDVPDDVYQVFQQGLDAKKLPAQKSGLAEWQFHLPVHSKERKLLGVIDGYIDYVTVEDGCVIVWDHKFTSNIKYAMSPNPKTKKALAKDLQAIVYAKLMFDMLRDLEYVECRWMYYGATKNPNSEDARPRTPGGFKRVEYAFTRDDIESRWGEVQDLAERIFNARRTKTRAIELVPNTNTCPKYGGCSAQKVCENERSKKALGFLNALSDTVKKEKEKMPTIAELKARRAAKNKIEDAEKIEPQDNVNPPDYAEEIIQKAEEAVDKLEGKKPRKVSKKEAKEKNEAIDRETLNKKPVAKADREEKPKRKRGRPPKKKEGLPEKEQTPDVAKKRKESLKNHDKNVPQDIKETPKDIQKNGLIVYLDCLPLKGGPKEVVLFSDYLGKAKRAIEETTEKPYWNLLKYREGEQLLAAHCKVLLEEEPPKGVLFCDSMSSEWKACNDVVTETAAVLIRRV